MLSDFHLLERQDLLNHVIHPGIVKGYFQPCFLRNALPYFSAQDPVCSSCTAKLPHIAVHDIVMDFEERSKHDGFLFRMPFPFLAANMNMIIAFSHHFSNQV